MPFTFEPLGPAGLLVIRPRAFPDSRGFFLESYKRSEFAKAGIGADFVQDNHSKSTRGVLRGLHYQLPPFAQGKLVRATQGRIWDVAVDIRKGSATYGSWWSIELNDIDHAMLWIPPGFAHGFVALSETVHLQYKCTAEYDKASEGGIRWDDPSLAIEWPLEDALVSEKDAVLPLLEQAVPFEGGL